MKMLQNGSSEDRVERMDAEIEIDRITDFISGVVSKSKSRGVVIGVSGGVDSALASALCARALGSSNVEAYILPAGVSTPEDLQDAERHCAEYGIPCRVVSIEPVLEAYRKMEYFLPERRLLGNLMARTRMAVLYYHANRGGRLVCGTSNRSEYLLGYCTKFGDSAADLQPILHLYKTEVYALARVLGIAERILMKPPSAGLWPGQWDEEEIGLTYREIDETLASLERKSWRSEGELEDRVLSMVLASRHKRIFPMSLLSPAGIPF
ncbi:MAG: NAD+ synthase [Methanomicrobiales archaeon]|nr:NAD+ synthase [Methanomicrobiales archaeon]